MVKTTVYLDNELALSLRHVAEVEGCSRAELIRHALKTYTCQWIRPMPTGTGEFHSGCTDTSRRAKEILREAAKRGVGQAGSLPPIRARFTASTTPTINITPVIATSSYPSTELSSFPWQSLGEIDYLLQARLGNAAELRFLHDISMQCLG